MNFASCVRPPKNAWHFAWPILIVLAGCRENADTPFGPNGGRPGGEIFGAMNAAKSTTYAIPWAEAEFDRDELPGPFSIPDGYDVSAPVTARLVVKGRRAHEGPSVSLADGAGPITIIGTFRQAQESITLHSTPRFTMEVVIQYAHGRIVAGQPGFSDVTTHSEIVYEAEMEFDDQDCGTLQERESEHRVQRADENDENPFATVLVDWRFECEIRPPIPVGTCLPRP